MSTTRSTFGAKPFVDVTEEDLHGYLNGNLKGTYVTTQAVVRQMQKEGGGSIVNIGTVLVDHAMAGMPASAALISKGGIHALTVSLAAELAADGADFTFLWSGQAASLGREMGAADLTRRLAADAVQRLGTLAPPD